MNINKDEFPKGAYIKPNSLSFGLNKGEAIIPIKNVITREEKMYFDRMIALKKIKLKPTTSKYKAIINEIEKKLPINRN